MQFSFFISFKIGSQIQMSRLNRQNINIARHDIVIGV